jgi:hypothetical protein
MQTKAAITRIAMAKVQRPTLPLVIAEIDLQARIFTSVIGAASRDSSGRIPLVHKKLPDEKDTRFLFDSLDKVVGPFRNRATDYAFGSFH